MTSTFPTTGFKNRTFLNVFISQSLNIIYTLIFTLSILHFILYQNRITAAKSAEQTIYLEPHEYQGRRPKRRDCGSYIYCALVSQERSDWATNTLITQTTSIYFIYRIYINTNWLK